jgi:hypothetical protein
MKDRPVHENLLVPRLSLGTKGNIYYVIRLVVFMCLPPVL